MRDRWLGILALLLVGCGGSDDDGPIGDGDADADADTDADADGDTDADGDGDSDGDGDADCEAVTTSDDPAVQEYIDWVSGVMLFRGIPGAAISILRGGDETRILLGRKHGGECGAVTSETRFQVGVSTRGFLAAAIADADADGTLGLDDSIAEYVDVVPPEVTFRHLLQGTSGGAPDLDFLSGPQDCTTLEDYFERRAQVPLWFTPGTLYAFSAPETSLAAYALGVADGAVGFEQSLQSRVFDRLGMNVTFDPVEAQAGDFATGHDGAALPVRPYCEAGAPVHGAYASIDDAARFLGFLMSDDPIAQAIEEPEGICIAAEVRTTLGGLWEGPYSDETTMVDMFGSFDGYYQSVAIFPGLDLGIVVLHNGGWGAAFSQKAAEIIGGATYEPYDHSTEPSTRGEYAGTYVDPLGIDGGGARTLEVTFDEGTSELTACLGPLCATLAPTPWTDTFDVTFGNVTASIRFWRDETGIPATVSEAYGHLGPPFYRQQEGR